MVANRFVFAVAAAIALAGISPAGANDACTEASSASLLCEFVTSVESYSADFTQVLTDEVGEVIESSEGQLWLQRPGKFRWSYATPWERLIVANETEVWLYDAELEQVTLRSADKAIEQTPAGLLAGNIESLDNYSVTTVSNTEGGSVVTLIPNSGSSDFQKIILIFSAQDLVSLSLQDRFGQLTSIKLSGIQRNPELGAELFSFSVPEGADLIDQRNN
jgi:outer membrane lipoprotein carrier protein